MATDVTTAQPAEPTEPAQEPEPTTPQEPTAQAEQPAQPKVTVPTPEGYEPAEDAVVRRSTGTVAGTFRPLKRAYLAVCEHGTQAEAKDRSEAHKLVTNPETFCKDCRKLAGKRQKDEVKALEAKLAALKGQDAS